MKSDPDSSDQVCFISFEIRIKDTGPGISKEDIGKLFVDFSRLADHHKLNK